MAWSESRNTQERKNEQPLPERGPAPPPPGGGCGTGFLAIATQNTRTRLERAAEAKAELAKPRDPRLAAADYYMAKYERECAEKKELEAKQARIAAENARVKEAHRLDDLRTREALAELQQKKCQQVLHNGKVREIQALALTMSATEADEVIRRLKSQGLLAACEPSFWSMMLQDIRSGK